MANSLPKLTLPDLDWKTATCEVCGKPFDYLGKRRPHTCKDGNCRYVYANKINPDKWATHQPGLFETSGKE